MRRLWNAFCAGWRGSVLTAGVIALLVGLTTIVLRADPHPVRHTATPAAPTSPSEERPGGRTIAEWTALAESAAAENGDAYPSSAQIATTPRALEADLEPDHGMLDDRQPQVTVLVVFGHFRCGGDCFGPLASEVTGSRIVEEFSTDTGELSMFGLDRGTSDLSGLPGVRRLPVTGATSAPAPPTAS